MRLLTQTLLPAEKLAVWGPQRKKNTLTTSTGTLGVGCVKSEHPGSGPTVLPDDPSEHSHISAVCLIFQYEVQSNIGGVCRISTWDFTGGQESVNRQTLY